MGAFSLWLSVLYMVITLHFLKASTQSSAITKSANGCMAFLLPEPTEKPNKEK